MMKAFCIKAVLLFAAASLAPGSQSAETPVDFNGSFEAGEESPLGWHPAESNEQCIWQAQGARSGVRALAGQPTRAKEVWASVPFSISPGTGYICDGWIRPTNGTGWIRVQYLSSDGKKIARWESPRVSGDREWTYVAVETTPLSNSTLHEPAMTAQVSFWVKGGQAALDDVAIHPVPSFDLINGDFDMPVDGKGRFPYWNEEEDDSLLTGVRGGSIAHEDTGGVDSSGCLTLTASGDWVAFTSIHYPIEEWSDYVKLTASVRCETGARARLLVAWTDGAQRVLRINAGEAIETNNWKSLLAGPFSPPDGARGIRPILVTQKKAGSAGPVPVRFDNIRLQLQSKPYVRVVVNQVGYELAGPKNAVVLTNFFPPDNPLGKVKLADETGRTVWDSELTCSGRMYGDKQADWGWYFWRAAFSEVDEDGEFTVEARIGKHGASSYPFKIGRDLVFQETAALNVDFFFVQRCGFEVPGWHQACHLDDATLEDGTHKDLTGGWHSAGDYNKLNWEYGDGGVLYALVNAALSASNYFAAYDRDKDGLEDIWDEAEWGAKYLAKLQIPETGGVLNHIEQGPDRKTWMKWCPPEHTTDNVVGTEDDPIVNDGEGSSPLAIGAWARLSAVLDARGVENDYLSRAVRLWEHASGNGTAVPNPLLLISSVDLHCVTSRERFLAYCRDNVEALLATGNPDGQLAGGYGDSGDIPAAALAHFALSFPNDVLTPAIKNRLKKHLPVFLSEADNPLGLMMQKPGEDGYYFEPTSALGCNFQICCRAWSALMVCRVTGDERALEYATNQLDFVLGKNPYDVCMMEGKGSRNLPRYHHRYITIPGRPRGAVPGAIPNGFVRDMASNDRPGMDLSTGGRPYPSYRTNEPWLVHNVFYMLAVTALHDSLR